MLSDFPRVRALRRESLVGTRSTRSPRAIRNRSSEPATCRQSSSAHTRCESSSRAHISSAPNPRAPTATVFSPATSPVPAATAAIQSCASACECPRQAPSSVLSSSTSRMTPGGHGLLGAVPRSYQVTPDIPDRRRATQRENVRPKRSTASTKVGFAAGRDLPPASDVTEKPNPNSKPQRSSRGGRGHCALFWRAARHPPHATTPTPSPPRLQPLASASALRRSPRPSRRHMDVRSIRLQAAQARKYGTPWRAARTQSVGGPPRLAQQALRALPARTRFWFDGATRWSFGA